MIKKIKSLTIDNIDHLPEMEHILTYQDCQNIVAKFNDLGAGRSLIAIIYKQKGKTILQAAKSLDPTSEFLVKIICIILNALWPDRFELLKYK